jgi:2-polyprenyl-3-methyl-5-hydroxy-6-metoxy-1,4-benzoquinol methylase
MGGVLMPATMFGQQATQSAGEGRSRMWNEVYSRPVPLVNPFPNRFLARSIEGLRAGRALDIGMGQGRNSVYLAAAGWDVTGVDISEKGVELALKAAEARQVKINAVVSDFAKFDTGKEQWDLIAEMYMHGMVIMHKARVVESLRPGGRLIVEGFHKDGKLKGLTGTDLGFDANELVAAFADSLKITYYEVVTDFGDWSLNGRKVMLVRMLAEKRPLR